MNIPFFHVVFNKISDLTEDSVLNLPYNIGDIRKNVNILIIDDNEFNAESHLTANGYQIEHKKDIDTIKDVEPYEIIMCDISGVGKNLGYEKEGAFIIREIHANYPLKRIIAYTSYTYNAEYNQFFSLADCVASKDLGIDDWISILDTQVKNAINPVKQWEKIRKYLLDNNVSTLSIAKIEDKYVQAIKKKDMKALTKFVSGERLNIKSIITEFSTSLCAKIILGAIGV